MKRLIKRCCPFLLGIALASSCCMGTVQASKKDNSKTAAESVVNGVEQQVDQFAEKYIGESIPGAVVVVVKDHQIVMEKAYGNSNVTTKTKMSTKDTTFELGTLTKMYTYTAVMQQVEAGKIDLSADIFTYLPEGFANKLKKHMVSDTKITVMHLMDNTAGFEETGFDNTVSDPSDLNATLEEALEKTMPQQIYEPGEVMTSASYCSALLGYIVECVTETEFSAYVKENIFDKLGAGSSTIIADTTKETKINDAKAVAYGLGSEGDFRTVDNMYSNLYPSSGVVASAEDLGKFLVSYLPKKGEEGTLLRPDTIQSMFIQTYSINENAKGQCLGFYEYPSDNVKAYYHDGSSNGYSSIMAIVPETGSGVAVLTNAAVSTEFMYGVTNLVLGGESTDGMPVVEDNMGFPNLDDFTQDSFIGARRAYNNVMELAGYFGNCCSFKKSDNNTLVLDGKEYVQIEPYVFQYVESSDKDKNTVLQETIAKYIYFGHDETGKVTKWSYGGSGTTEFVAMDHGSTQSYLTLGIFGVIVGALLCAVLFSTSLLLTALDFVHKKKQMGTPKMAFRISVLFFVGLEYSVVNELMKLLENNLVASREIFWNTIANYGFTVAILLSFGYFVYCRDNEKTKPGRALFYGVVYAFMALFIGLMFIWNFFTIM